jgi:hypothetical protein
MNIRVGSTKFSDFKRGTSNVSYIYRGSDLIWQRVEERLYFLRAGSTNVSSINLSNGTVTSSNVFSTGVNTSSVLHHDRLGNVYVGGQTTLLTQVAVRKFRADGTLVWSKTASNLGQASQIIRNFAVDSQGNIYIACVQYSTNPSLISYDKNGNLRWSKTNINATKVRVDLNDDVYVSTNRVNNITLRKYNSSGTELWTADHGANLLDVEVTPDNGVIVVGNLSGSIGGRKYNSSGTQVFTISRRVSNTLFIQRVAVRLSDGHFVICERESNANNGVDDGSVRVFNSSGSVLFTYTQTGNSTSGSYFWDDVVWANNGDFILSTFKSQTQTRTHVAQRRSGSAFGTIVWDLFDGDIRMYNLGYYPNNQIQGLV